jgi:hypothetical protein
MMGAIKIALLQFAPTNLNLLSIPANDENTEFFIVILRIMPKTWGIS